MTCIGERETGVSIDYLYYLLGFLQICIGLVLGFQICDDFLVLLDIQRTSRPEDEGLDARAMFPLGPFSLSPSPLPASSPAPSFSSSCSWGDGRWAGGGRGLRGDVSDDVHPFPDCSQGWGRGGEEEGEVDECCVLVVWFGRGGGGGSGGGVGGVKG